MELKHTLLVALALCHYLVSIEAATPKKVGECAWESEGITLDLSKVAKYISITGSDDYPYRYYPCETETWKLECTTASKAAICQDNPPSTMVIVGKLTSTTVAAVINEKAKTATFTMTYKAGTPVYGGPERNGIVTVTCFQEKDTFTFDHEDSSAGQYYFTLDVEKACTRASAGTSGGEPADGAALFITLIVVAIVAVSVYLVAGVLLMAFWKKERGLKLIPNFEFWKDFPFLLKDGFLFTFSCFPPLREKIGPDRGTYESLK